MGHIAWVGERRNFCFGKFRLDAREAFDVAVEETEHPAVGRKGFRQLQPESVTRTRDECAFARKAIVERCESIEREGCHCAREATRALWMLEGSKYQLKVNS